MDNRSRYRRVSRRQMLQGSAGLGIAAFLSACGTNDAEVFANTSADLETTTTSEPTTSAPTTTDQATTSSAAASSGVAPNPAGEVAIAFTYAFGNGGKMLNPYIAVWIEDSDGNLLRTNALWFEQTQKGPRWLSDLKRWYVQDQDGSKVDAIETVSSATRQPGSFNVSWDGLDELGQPVSGSVFVCIEAARERGPYSLIRETYEVGTAGSLSLGDDGELSNASVTSV